MTQNYRLSSVDLDYIRTNFVRFEDACVAAAVTVSTARALRDREVLPHPTYVLDDGTEYVPADFFTLLKSVSEPDRVRPLLIVRLTARAQSHHELLPDEAAEGEWRSYLSGDYGVCLREVTPENMYDKERLVRRLSLQLATPLPAESLWCHQLRSEVDALDALLRPFALSDRARFGGFVSRDRLVTLPRLVYSHAFNG